MNRTITLAVTGAALALGITACGGSTPSAAPATPGSAVTASQPSVSPAASVIAGQLAHAGLGVTHLITYTEATDPNHLMGRQGGYTSKVAWTDPAAITAGAQAAQGGSVTGGGIEVFPTAAEAQARYAKLKGFTAPIGDGYDYLAGTAVLRLSQYLTPAQAAAYRAAFMKAAS